jgi:hypothetical protein
VIAREGGGAEEQEQTKKITESVNKAAPEKRRLKSAKIDLLRLSIREK